MIKPRLQDVGLVSPNDREQPRKRPWREPPPRIQRLDGRSCCFQLERERSPLQQAYHAIFPALARKADDQLREHGFGAAASQPRDDVQHAHWMLTVSRARYRRPRFCPACRLRDDGLELPHNPLRGKLAPNGLITPRARRLVPARAYLA